MGKRIFGELELAILNILKQSGSSLTVRDVLERLEKGDKYTTIMTVMNRLAAKKVLCRKKQGLTYRYSIQTQQPRFTLLEKWRQKIFGGSSALMIGYLLESGQDITEEELKQIEALIEAARRNG